MKKSVKITFSAVFAALAAVFMTVSLIPNLTLAAPAVAGLVFIAVYFELGFLPAIAAFAVSSFVSFFVSDKTSWVLFVLFFGYYPILKPIIEKTQKLVLEWIIKFSVFGISAFFCYTAELLLFDIKLKWWLLLLLYLLGNAVFALYDIAVSRTAYFYYARIHPKINKMIKP